MSPPRGERVDLAAVVAETGEEVLVIRGGDGDDSVAVGRTRARGVLGAVPCRDDRDDSRVVQPVEHALGEAVALSRAAEGEVHYLGEVGVSGRTSYG
jgi:hypothetical protein